MSVLTKDATDSIQGAIDAHLGELRETPGFVAAEPGFPLVDGTFIEEPAIIVWVDHKEPSGRPPGEVDGYGVYVMQADPVRQLEAVAAASVQRAGPAVYTYRPPDGNPIDQPFTVRTPLLCHVGPDAGWPALRTFLKATKSELWVSIYDFNAEYIATALVEDALEGNIEVTMNWDDSPRVQAELDTMAQVRAKLPNLFRDEIVRTGSGRRFANSYHVKVAVQDSAAFWLSSGNWTNNSQPDIDPVGNPDDRRGMYGKGNREWHVIVNDPDLSKLFEQYLRYDFEQSEQEARERAPEPPAVELPDVFVPLADVVDERAIAAPPEPVAPRRLPAAGGEVRVQPVLTPDNYVERVTALLKSAQHSINMQFAYITYSDAPGDERFTEMLAVLRDASNNPAIETKIIVGSTQAAEKVGVLVRNGFNQKVFRQQSKIHNKGVIVDGEVVLVSSANWSSDGVLRNRDAGLIISDPEIAGYYAGVFEYDWDNRASAITESGRAIIAPLGAPTPPGMARISWADYVGD